MHDHLRGLIASAKERGYGRDIIAQMVRIERLALRGQLKRGGA